MTGLNNRFLTIGDFQYVITEFDRKYPNALDDEAAEHIKTSRKTMGFVLLSLFGSIISIWICVSLLQNYPQDLFLFVVFLFFITPFVLWKFVKASMRFWSGRRALRRNAATAGIPAVDLRNLRKAYRQIRSWREAQANQKHSDKGAITAGIVGGVIGTSIGSGGGQSNGGCS
ncbi:MAG: hypothetical protein ACR2RE_14605 [Geminicoccaceae bacterium]